MSKPQKSLDLLIIGAGVAGLTAGIYGARLKLKTLILEDEIIGGQIVDAYVIENYPGFDRIKGSELIDRMQEQARRAGAEIDEFDKIETVTLTDEEKIVETQNWIYRPAVVIIAAGMKRRELPIPQEKQFRGRGVHYCELCDGHIYNGKTIAVVGGGNGAVDAVNFLNKYANRIYLIHRLATLEADAVSQEKMVGNDKVVVMPNSRIIEARGETALNAIVVENLGTLGKSELPVDGIFVYIGFDPKTNLYQKEIILNEAGYIVADESCETNVQGVYAAGDIRTKGFRQLTTAAGDGTIAALQAEKYIRQRNG